MYEQILDILDTIGELIWGPPTWVLLALVGIVLSVRMNGFQVTKFTTYFKETLGKLFAKKDPNAEPMKGDITPFQAFTTAMAATMGVGNLVGSTTAIMFGGPGAIFWMWVIGFLGITTKFAEIALAIHYRETNDKGMIIGGPMKYIEKGLGWKWLSVIFCIAGSLAAFGIGNLVQANNVASSLYRAFNIPLWASGVGLMVIVGAVILGGVKRVGQVAEKAVPTAAIVMIIGCLLVVFQNFGDVPAAFGLIFRYAFTTSAATGGFVGATIAMAIRFGLMRGIFSNEAGLGSAPIAHAAAVTDHPVRQGFWGAMEVVLDTHVVCTMVALAVITSGAWLQDSTVPGAAMSAFMYAFSSSFIGETVGNAFASIAILLFALTTMLGWSFYGEKCLEYLAGSKTNILYRLIFIPMLFVGAFNMVPVWAVSDILNAMMAITNVIGVLALSTVITNITKSYFKGEKYVPYDEDPDYYKNYGK